MPRSCSRAIQLAADDWDRTIKKMAYERRDDLVRAKENFSKAVALPAGDFDFGHGELTKSNNRATSPTASAWIKRR